MAKVKEKRQTLTELTSQMETYFKSFSYSKKTLMRKSMALMPYAIASLVFCWRKKLHSRLFRKFWAIPILKAPKPIFVLIWNPCVNAPWKFHR